VNDWFEMRAHAFMLRDVRSAIVAKQDFGAAVMLVCYTEVLGGLP
jgi:hypothetical protein